MILCVGNKYPDTINTKDTKDEEGNDIHTKIISRENNPPFKPNWYIEIVVCEDKVVEIREYKNKVIKLRDCIKIGW